LPQSAADWLESRKDRLRSSVPAFQFRDRALFESFRDALALLESSGSTAGDYLEFGVFRGASLNAMYRASEGSAHSGIRVIGFDSFQGLPDDVSSVEAGVWAPGAFKSELAETKAWLSEQAVDPGRTVLVPGWFDETLKPETAAQLSIEQASVVMIDCDLYSAAKLALEFAAPLFRDKALLYFDDWSIGNLDEKNSGEKLAFEEFVEGHPEFAIDDFPAYSSQSRVFVLSRR
jgi:hypothetical protein